MTRGRTPSGSAVSNKKAAPGKKARTARPVSKAASRPGAAGNRPTGNRSADGELHVRPGSFRKPKTDSRPAPASRRKPEGTSVPDSETSSSREITSTREVKGGSAPSRSKAASRVTGSSGGRAGPGTRSGAKKPNPPKLRGPQLDTPPPGTLFKDRDGKTHSFPDSALKRIAAQILTSRNKKWRYRAFSFPLLSASGSEHDMYFDFYVYDNMDSIFKLILLMPRESREVWDRVGRFKQQYPMYVYELWTPDFLAKVQGPKGSLGW